MRQLILALLISAIANSVLALEDGDYGGTMGIYFSETEFTVETMNLTTPPSVFYAYIVLTDAQVINVLAYEVGITLSSPDALILGASGPMGWVNFGTAYDHLVGYNDPLPVNEDGTIVLSRLTGVYDGTDQVDFLMGASSLESVPGWDGPVILDPDNDVLLVCHLSSGATGYQDAVAWLNRDVVAVETATWSAIKELF
jgi:hypothetical protein